ncbi:hypothetical protein PQX77_018550 [Marasmius sp. AFHP31]|nr:hypothetical protein PQX77_018550 [Marasmius sp. AFHP31]
MNNLPTDVFQGLVAFAWIDFDDLKNLRLTSKPLYSATDQAFWTNQLVKVIIDGESDNEAPLAKLEAFVAKPGFAGRIQRLELDVSILELEREAMKRTREILGDGVRALKGLRSVSLDVSGSDPEWAPDTICEALATLPLLSSLSIKASYMQYDLPPSPLHLFTSSPTDPSLYIQPLRALLTSNPNLAHLDLQFHPQFTLPVAPFSDLFTVAFSKPLRLESLTLLGWTVDFTPHVLPHIRGLRTLKFLDQRERIGASCWDVLRSSGIHLRHIKVYNPGPGFVDYMSSFSGLEILDIQETWVVEQEESDRLARRFYEDALPKHQATLQEVTISCLGLRLWNFGTWNSSAFDKCTKLVSLRVTVSQDDILASEDPEVNIVVSLLSLSVSHTKVSLNIQGTLVKHALTLVGLRTLEVTPAFNPRNYGGLLSITAALRAVDNIVEGLKLALKGPPLLTTLIRAGLGKHTAEVVSEGEVRYKFVPND